MFKKPKISKLNKFSGMSSENEFDKQQIINNEENSNLKIAEDINLKSNKLFEKSEKENLISSENKENSESNKLNAKTNFTQDSINNIETPKHSELSEQKEAIKKMLNKNQKISAVENKAEINLPLDENAEINLTKNREDNNNNNPQNEALDYSYQINKIKAEIDKKNQKPKRRGTVIKPLEKVLTTYNKSEENSDPGIKKIFISEYELINTKNPEDLKKLMGVNKEEIDKEKKSKLQKILDHQKDLFTLPEDLRVTPETKNDYVDNLIKLSAAGLIEVPLSLENKLKNIEETEIMKKQIIDKRLVEELDYLKVLKKLGPSYAKGYKNDLSRKKLTKLNSMFENVFTNLNGRRRKLFKEKMISDNRLCEQGYIRQKEDVHSDKNSDCGNELEEENEEKLSGNKALEK